MLTLVLGLLIFVLLHQANEGVTCFRWPGPPVLAAVQIGQARVVVRRYRRRRIYFRFSFAPICAIGGT